MAEDRVSQFYFLAGHEGPKRAQINTVALCVSMYFETVQGPNMKGWQAGFGPWASILRTPVVGPH